MYAGPRSLVAMWRGREPMMAIGQEETDMRESRGNNRALMGLAAVAFAIVLIAAFFWADHNKEAARNDPRTGTTTETSPRNPTPGPGGGSDKSGG